MTLQRAFLLAMWGLAGMFVAVPGCGKTPAASATSTSTAPAVDPVTVIAVQIDNGIKLLQENKDQEALEALANPLDLKKWKTQAEFDGVVKDFKASGKAAELLAALQAAKGQKPKFSDKNTVATFPHESSAKELIFEKRDKNWYLRN